MFAILMKGSEPLCKCFLISAGISSLSEATSFFDKLLLNFSTVKCLVLILFPNGNAMIFTRVYSRFQPGEETGHSSSLMLNNAG